MTAAKPQNYFDLYKQRRQQVLTLANEQLAIVTKLGLDEAQIAGTKPGDVLSGLIQKLESDAFRVLVIGRFSAGKSTFVNALFGEVALPASPNPTTGVLCEIKYADEANKRARLFPKDGFGINGGNDPFDIRITDLRKELEKYVKIDHFVDSEATSRYKKMELFWPLALCKNGVELIDSVGLDDPTGREEVTMKYARTVDAILFCIDCQNAYTAKDQQVLTLLKSLNCESFFFILTHYDAIRESAQLGQVTEEEFRQLQSKNLSQWTELKERGIKYVDSKTALLGRTRGDRQMIVTSGILDVESALEDFLTQDKGRAKLLSSLKSLGLVNRLVRDKIPSRIGMWQTKVSDLEDRYRRAQLPLQTLEQSRQLMIGSADAGIKRIAWQARGHAETYFEELRQNVKKWSADYEIQVGFGFPPSVKPVVAEVVEHIKGRIEQDAAEWGRTVLNPMVEEQLSELERSLETHARKFAENARKIRIQMSVGTQVSDDEMAKEHEPSVVGRLIAGGYTLLTGDFITGAAGVFLGLKGMMTTIAFQAAAGIILGLLNLLNPLAIIAAVIAAGFAGGFANIFMLKRQIKQRVGEKLAENLAEKRQELGECVRCSVETELAHLKTALDEGLQGEIGSLRGEVESVIKEKKKGQLDADKEISQLRQLEAANAKLEHQIDELKWEAGIPASK